MPTDPHPLSRVFLDSSVLFAALASATGASRAIILLAEIRLVKLVVIQQVFDEVERNLARKAPLAVPLFQRLVGEIEWEIVPDANADLVTACSQVIPVKDATILAAAMSVHPARFVTLDQVHFLTDSAKNFSKLQIQTPAEFINEVRLLLAVGFSGRE
ncbi:MAG: PIN domain-containing protein [Chloroflexi bacterium]|nr:PIN domain-containing protein [Chloroflexota bacterium]